MSTAEETAKCIQVAKQALENGDYPKVRKEMNMNVFDQAERFLDKALRLDPKCSAAAQLLRKVKAEQADPDQKKNAQDRKPAPGASGNSNS